MHENNAYQFIFCGSDKKYVIIKETNIKFNAIVKVTSYITDKLTIHFFSLKSHAVLAD